MEIRRSRAKCSKDPYQRHAPMFLHHPLLCLFPQCSQFEMLTFLSEPSKLPINTNGCLTRSSPVLTFDGVGFHDPRNSLAHLDRGCKPVVPTLFLNAWKFSTLLSKPIACSTIFACSVRSKNSLSLCETNCTRGSSRNPQRNYLQLSSYMGTNLRAYLPSHKNSRS